MTDSQVTDSQMTGTQAISQHPDLETTDIVKNFGETVAVNQVNFQVPKGSFFSILGPSGCGKTTLMRMIAGFEYPSSGDILIRGDSVIDVPPNRRPVNMVFQHLALFPMMNVAKNIGYGLRRRGVKGREIDIAVDSVLDRVGLPGMGPRKIDQLSGGQKQRIAIARCLILEPTLLLLDEPLGALDLKLREQMKIELKQLQAEIGTTFLYITHDQSEALIMSDQVAVMNHGRFEQIATPQELYYRPKTSFVASFVGDANRWSGKVESIDGGELRLHGQGGVAIVATAADGLTVGMDVEIFVRPEAVFVGLSESEVGDYDNRIQGTVDNLLFDGGRSSALISVAGDDRDISVALPQTGQFSNLKHGEKIYLGWQADQTRCFAANKDDAK